ncbi:MAG: hypothetical protein HC769_34800 [Cyanobacteria bacterium CRU_2_1]|nr:hypothetical protein [Cyanobacteria bacterium CRU_2_1]
MKQQVAAAQASGASALDPLTLAELEQSYADILQRGCDANPPQPIPEPSFPHRRR